jgi:hypothetical protein
VSTLLQRLAGQAIGAPTRRVRAAERMRAQVPIVIPPAAPAARVDTRTPSADAISDETFARGIEPSPQRPAAPHRARNSNDGHAPRALDRSVPAFAPFEPHLAESLTATDREPTGATALTPTPLLEQVALAAPMKTVVGSIQPAARHAAKASSEPTEVHVHIGRVDVTAVQSPSPPPRKRESTPRRGVALSDYLARRRSS